MSIAKVDQWIVDAGSEVFLYTLRRERDGMTILRADIESTIARHYEAYMTKAPETEVKP